MLDQQHARTQQMVERIRGLAGDKRAQLFAKLRQAGVRVERLPIVPALPNDAQVLSFAQQRQWFLWQLEPSGSGYNIASALRLRGRLDLNALQKAFAGLVQRHASLRTMFVQQGDTVQQHVREHLADYFTVLQLEGERTDLLERVRAQVQQPFDLRCDALIRVCLLRVSADDQVLVLTLQHIIADAWSMNLLVEELFQRYAAACAGREPKLAVPALCYGDFAAWQRQWLASGEGERQLGYWVAQLGAEQPVLELPCDRPRPAVQSFRGARHDFTLPQALCAALTQLAQAQGVTMFTLLLTAWQALLYRYTGQTDIRIGVPVANRNREETEGLIGFFVNTQVLRAEVDGLASFGELLKQVRDTVLQAQDHQDLPFEQLVEALHPERSLSVNPLFQVMFNHQVSAPLASQQLPGVELEEVDWAAQQTHFDLTLNTSERPDGLHGALVYATDLFDEARMARMAADWQRLLEGVVEDSEQLVAHLPVLPASQLARFAEWNTQAPAYAGPLVHEHIAGWAARTPDAIALVCGTRQLSFAALDCQANRLAHALIARGVGPESKVAVLLERGIELPLALLAVLKAGAAYVPLDPEYPRQRLEYLLDDCAMGLLLTQTSLVSAVPPGFAEQMLVLDELDLANHPADPPVVALSGDNLAYVIYTSGSTGQPKGVGVTHGPLAMHCAAIGERYAMSSTDCELHFMSFAFDGAHERWLTALGHGARLLLRDNHLWTPAHTYAQMHLHQVSVAAFPPAYLQQLAEHGERDGNPPSVRVYCFGGDAVSEALFEQAQRALRPTFIINGYGPTETVVTPLLWKADSATGCGAAYAPIGARVGNRTAHVLDDNLQQVSCSQPGELYLGGEGIARGYLGRPGLTAERFIPDPFGAPGTRLYRSGDRVSQRECGVVDYLGRVDHQVKIRGFRIELGEIESRLLAEAGVRDALVQARSLAAGKQLVAYLLPSDSSLDDAGKSRLREQLKSSLKQHLASYMIPAHWVFLQQFPLTPNAKVDRKALPDPVASEQVAYLAPQSALQQQLAEVWQQVLGVTQVGLDDNFFELGGHSLLATQVTAQLQLKLSINVPLEKLFMAASLADYAEAVERCRPTQVSDDLSEMHDFIAELEAN
ncbi:amino acid adenylation domain-containing protein [Pseudomonas farsensis]|uniref:Amino acid adenylation domain-containing protein n=1 Tax=Pseudomonas farsensis TaxID=2745492 RepID=A0ABU8QZE8_9PSED